jgi:hypothetical protein
MEQKISISQRVLEYIKRKPYIQEAIEQGIVNYSALARQIANDIGANFEAVKASLIRHSEKFRKDKENREKEVIKLLQLSNFSIKNKIATLHCSSSIDIEAIAYSKTPSGYMYFLDENVADKTNFGNIDYGFAIIHIRSPIKIEKTPGVAAFLLSTLASENINVVHLMDCREDTFLVIEEKDAPLAFKALAEKLRM